MVNLVSGGVFIDHIEIGTDVDCNVDLIVNDGVLEKMIELLELTSFHVINVVELVKIYILIIKVEQI